MARFRLILINLAIWLTLLFNLERPDIVGIGNIDLASPVYVYAAVLTVVILMFPDLSHVHPSYLIIPGIGVYLAFGFIIGNLTTDVIFVYTTIIEIVAIAITIALARLVSSTVTEFENVVENTALTASNSRVLPQDEGIAQIDRELFRARRFLHPTALLFLDISSVKKSEVSLQKQLDLQLALEKRYLQGRIARTIEQVLYPDDILSLYHDDLVLCFPETNLDQATEMANEIYKLLGITLRIKMSIGIAAFPEDALIFEELIAAAKSNIKSFNDEYTNNDDEPSDGSPLVSQNGGRYPEGLSEEPATPPSFLSEALPTSLPIPLIENQVDAGTLSYTLTQSNESRSEIRGDLGASSGTGTLTLALAGQSNRTTRQNEEVAPTQRLSNIRLLMDAMFTTPRLPFSLSNEIGEHSPDTDPDFWVNKLPFQSRSSRQIFLKSKRIIDIGIVLASLVVTLPLIVLISIATLIDSGRPIFFVQVRTGKGGKRFKMYKFRTMVPNAEELLKELAAQGLAKLDKDGKLAEPLKLKRDPRVTRLGRILRKTSLDELPQIFNVLSGSMSLVGPRPTSWDVGSYTLLQTERLSIRPGITGLWQVCSRGNTDFDNWLKWDLKYIEKMSFLLDIKIIIRTLAKVLKRSGAH